MYDSETARIEECRLRFEKQIADPAADARELGMGYLAALGAFVDAFHGCPGADPLRMSQDTTGSWRRIEDHVEWAEGERHRVRRVLTTFV